MSSFSNHSPALPLWVRGFFSTSFSVRTSSLVTWLVLSLYSSLPFSFSLPHSLFLCMAGVVMQVESECRLERAHIAKLTSHFAPSLFLHLSLSLPLFRFILLSLLIQTSKFLSALWFIVRIVHVALSLSLTKTHFSERTQKSFSDFNALFLISSSFLKQERENREKWIDRKICWLMTCV